MVMPWLEQPWDRPPQGPPAAPQQRSHGEGVLTQGKANGLSSPLGIDFIVQNLVSIVRPRWGLSEVEVEVGTLGGQGGGSWRRR